ncbi:uncharacterized protein LOC144579883 [Callithrix jacchus]
MHVPSVAAAVERGDGRTLQFLHTPLGPQIIKVLRETGQKQGYAEPGDADSQLGFASLSQAPSGSTRLGSASLALSLLASRLARAPPRARSPRPVPPLESGLDTPRCSHRAVKG